MSSLLRQAVCFLRLFLDGNLLILFFWDRPAPSRDLVPLLPRPSPARVCSTQRIASNSKTTSCYIDLVQDLYIRELKAYKPLPVVSTQSSVEYTYTRLTERQAKDAHVGVVKQYTMPPTPKAPTLPSDLATELSAYDATEPTSASAPAVKTPSSPEESVTGADAFLSFLEEDLPEEEDAHH